MTRKDYVALSFAIRLCSQPNGSGDTLDKKSLVAMLCTLLKEDNPRFDETMFRQACGTGRK